MKLTFSIPGTPLAKKRHRSVPMFQCLTCNKVVHGHYGSCPNCGNPLRFLKNQSYSDSDSVKYENLVAYSARQAMLAAKLEKMFARSLKVRMEFRIPIPESRRCKKTHEVYEITDPSIEKQLANCKKLHPGDPHSQRPDVDNCVKSILDGLNEVLFVDDAIIFEITARKVWSDVGVGEVEVEEL